MKRLQASKLGGSLSSRAWAILFLVGAAILGAAVLLPGFELATELSNSTAALKFVAEQQRNVDLLRTSMDSVRDRLESLGSWRAPELDHARVRAFADEIFCKPRPLGREPFLPEF